MLAVPNDLYNGCRLDHERSGRSRKDRYTVDTNNQLRDLDYADDICFLSQKLQHMQTKTNNPEQIAEKSGLRISKDKTKVMRANTKQQDKIK